MKKNLFLLGLAVAAMTSCTNDEVVDVMQPTQKAIGFETFVNKGTRAVTETKNPTIENSAITGLSKFHVFGYYTNSGTSKPVFTNQAVTGSVGYIDEAQTEEDIFWEYASTDADLKYWTQNPYMFAAYADQNASSQIATTGNGATVGFEEGTLTFTNYTVSDNNDLVADVVAADNSNYEAYGNKVAFSFGHMLTKIYFKIQNTDSKYRMIVTSPLTITGVKNQGTATIVENGTISWTPTPSGTVRDNFVPGVAKEENITNNVFTKATGIWTSEEYLVMPQQAISEITFSIEVNFIDENDQVVTTKTFTDKEFNVTTVDKWGCGLVYCYTIRLTTAAKPIEFDVSGVAGWRNYGNSIELNPSDDGTNGTN